MPAITPTNNATTPPATAGVTPARMPKSRFSSMSSEDFMKIIFTELQSQDPFKPNDSSAMLQQLNSIRSIESDVALTDNMKTIVFQNQLSSAGGLIGKRIAGLNADSQRVGGVVKSVARSDNEVALVLDTGWTIPMNNVEYIDGGGTPSTGTP
jgi:flagellar basal-body rod modification protein FlgD